MKKRIIHITIDNFKELIEDSYIDGYLDGNKSPGDQADKEVSLMQADALAREYVNKVCEDL